MIYKLINILTDETNCLCSELKLTLITFVLSFVFSAKFAQRCLKVMKILIRDVLSGIMQLNANGPYGCFDSQSGIPTANSILVDLSKVETAIL